MERNIKFSAISIQKPGKIIFHKTNSGRLKPDEALIRTKACGICKLDINSFIGKFKDSYSHHPGHEGVGIIEEVGKDVQEFKTGDKVAAVGSGAFGTYFKAHQDMVAKIPQEIKDFEYWISEPCACVVNGLRAVNIQPGDIVVIIGCGYMGLLLIQGIPKNFVSHLFCIDVDDKKLQLAKKFGADTILNPNHVDVVDYIRNQVGEVDIVIEAAGVKGTLEVATKLLRQGGKLSIFGYHIDPEIIDTGTWHAKGLWVLNPSPMLSLNFSKDFQDAVKLMRKGVFTQQQLITHKFPFPKIQEAFSFIASNPSDYIKGVILFDKFL